MLGRKPKIVSIKLDGVTNDILNDMETFGPGSPEYSTLLGYLERVSALRKSDDKHRISPDGLILVAGNLLGILIIVAYEQKHVMTSKGLGFVLKSK